MPDLLPSAALAPILARHRIALLVLFGSRARGSATESSDVDLALQRDDGRPMALLDLGLVRDALAALTPHLVDVLDLAAADALVRFEVARDGKVLHEDLPGGWRAFMARTLIDHDDIAHALPALVAGVGRAARAGRTHRLRSPGEAQRRHRDAQPHRAPLRNARSRPRACRGRRTTDARRRRVDPRARA